MASMPPVRAVAAVLLVAAAAAAFLATRDDAPATPGTGEVALATWKAFYRAPTNRIPHELATNPGTPWGDYVGSRACEACHAKAYAAWRDSFHSRTLYDVHPRTVFGDFSGNVVFDDPKFAFTVRPYASDGRFVLRIARRRGPPPAGTSAYADDTYGAGLPDVPEGDFPIAYAFGNRRHQPYVTQTPDGRHWVLPVVWDDVLHAWSWGGWRPYVDSCASCHVTGVKVSDRPLGPARLRADGTVVEPLAIGSTVPPKFSLPPPQEGWAEGAVGCEVCHGPGRAHVETTRAMGDEAYRAYLAAGGAPTIYDPAKDTPERRMQQCDSCHNFFSESSITFVPTPTGYPHAPLQAPISPADPLAKRQFYANGADMSPCTVGRVLRASRMGAKGVECRDCHDVHGNADWAELTSPSADNSLCLRCHAANPSGEFADAAAVARHARHRADGPGVLCVECHMPRDMRFSDGIHVMSTKIHSHAMSIPTGREDEGGGPTPACNLCHTDRDSAWTRRTLEGWKRDGARK